MVFTWTEKVFASVLSMLAHSSYEQESRIIELFGSNGGVIYGDYSKSLCMKSAKQEGVS
jgi:hypothetical protein